ncbi:uncharacterized protein LOC142349559 isoform X2 [Convolutriloba macropyga]|uniref:uncharacterized protein LOC142349559 isoform X2 n=1 Tax=Convolutriloba macropyga TaxID=536237 RepID=UPI003F52785A
MKPYSCATFGVLFLGILFSQYSTYSCRQIVTGEKGQMAHHNSTNHKLKVFTNASNITSETTRRKNATGHFLHQLLPISNSETDNVAEKANGSLAIRLSDEELLSRIRKALSLRGQCDEPDQARQDCSGRQCRKTTLMNNAVVENSAVNPLRDRIVS